MEYLISSVLENNNTLTADSFVERKTKLNVSRETFKNKYGKNHYTTYILNI